jgi:predicted nucleic acid-binding protein
MKGSSMMTLDASALVKLVIDEDSSNKIRRIVYKMLSNNEPIIAPSIALHESMNVLWVYSVGRRKLSKDKALIAFDRLLQIWSLMKHADSEDLNEMAMIIALDSKLTVYDSLYVAASVLYKSPLLTFDKDMRTKAEHIGVAIVKV